MLVLNRNMNSIRRSEKRGAEQFLGNKKKKVVDARNVACDALWLLIPEVRRSLAGDEVEIWLNRDKDKSDIKEWSSRVQIEVQRSPSEKGNFEKLIIRNLGP